MKIWRVTSEGSWPEFSEDVQGKNIDEAILNFEAVQQSKGSIANRDNIIKIQKISDVTILDNSGKLKHE